MKAFIRSCFVFAVLASTVAHADFSTSPIFGTIRHLLIIVRFPDATYPPQGLGGNFDPATADTRMNELAQFVEQNSYGRAYLQSDIAQVMVPGTLGSYVNAGPVYGYNNLQTDARAAAVAAGYVINNYHVVGIIFTRVNTWGSGLAGAAPGPSYNNAIYNGSPLLATLIHEFTHCMGGWSHVGGFIRDSVLGSGGGYEQYVDPVDPVGDAGGLGIKATINPAHAKYIGWISAGNIATFTYEESGTFPIRLYSRKFGLPDSSAFHAAEIKVRNGRSYWVDNYLNPGSPLSGAIENAVMIRQQDRHHGNTSLVSPLMNVLDANPHTPVGVWAGEQDTPHPLGSSFYDPYHQVRITVVGRGSSPVPYVDVWIHLGNPSDGNLSPVVSVSASSASAATYQNVTFTASVVDNDGPVSAMLWRSDDGFTQSGGSSYTRLWSSAGIHYVDLIVNDGTNPPVQKRSIVTIGSGGMVSVRGVILKAGNSPVQGALVRAGSFVGVTDSLGQFRMSMPDGVYSFSASKHGFSLSLVGSNPVSVNSTTAPLTFAATHNRSVCGVITDNGDPLHEVKIEGSEGGAWYNLFYTAEDGSYCIDELKSGTNFLVNPESQLNNYIFTPDARMYRIRRANIYGANFEAIEDHLPIANAGPAMVVYLGQVVTFSGAASYDLEQQPLYYKWYIPGLGNTNWSISPTVTHTFTAIPPAGYISAILYVSDNPDALTTGAVEYSMATVFVSVMP